MEDGRSDGDGRKRTEGGKANGDGRKHTEGGKADGDGREHTEDGRLTTGSQKTPDNPAYARFSVNGRTYSHNDIYIPEGNS